MEEQLQQIQSKLGFGFVAYFSGGRLSVLDVYGQRRHGFNGLLDAECVGVFLSGEEQLSLGA